MDACVGVKHKYPSKQTSCNYQVCHEAASEMFGSQKSQIKDIITSFFKCGYVSEVTGLTERICHWKLQKSRAEGVKHVTSSRSAHGSCYLSNTRSVQRRRKKHLLSLRYVVAGSATKLTRQVYPISFL